MQSFEPTVVGSVPRFLGFLLLKVATLDFRAGERYFERMITPSNLTDVEPVDPPLLQCLNLPACV